MVHGRSRNVMWLDIFLMKVLVGDGGSRKTAFACCWKEHALPDPHVYVPTVFEKYKTKVGVGDQEVLLQVWDTSGQEELKNIRTLSYDR